MFNMSSSAFCHGLDFRFPDPGGQVYRWCGFRLTRVVARDDGSWFVVCGNGPGVPGELRGGWIAGGGRIAGLRWITRGGHRVDCGLFAPDPRARNWRRLLVRLRVPMHSPLS